MDHRTHKDRINRTRIGGSDTRLPDVMARTGLSKTTIWRHFRAASSRIRQLSTAPSDGWRTRSTTGSTPGPRRAVRCMRRLQRAIPFVQTLPPTLSRPSRVSPEAASYKEADVKSGAISTSALVPMRGAPWAEELARALGGKKLGKQWSACCPAHDDKSPSLIIFEGRRGAVQVRCMAGCEPIEIIAEIRWHEVADRLSMTPPPPGERWFTVVHSISPGVRVRRHVLNFEDAETDVDEDTCRKTYEALETLPQRELAARLRKAAEGRSWSGHPFPNAARLMYLRACVAGAPRIAPRRHRRPRAGRRCRSQRTTPGRAPIPAAARDPVLPTLLSGRAPRLSRDGDGSRCRRPPQSST